MNSIEKYLKWYKEQDPDNIENLNRIQMEHDEIDFIDFKKKLEKGICKYCELDFKSVNIDKICFHWLLRPIGINKKEIIKVLDHYDCIQIRSYLRWLAQSESFLRNINDLRDEQSSNMIIHETIKYKNIEWSIYCNPNDFIGHSEKRISSTPHYHLQIKIDNKIYFKYSDHHIKLSDYDLFILNMIIKHPDKFAFFPSYGVGIQTVIDNINPEDLLAQMKPSKDESKAQYNVQTFIKTKEGKTIKGDLIYQAIQESKKRNIPIAQVLKEMKLDAEVVIKINPSDNLPDMSNRSKRKRGHK